MNAPFSHTAIADELIGADIPRDVAMRAAPRMARHRQLVTRDAPRTTVVEYYHTWIGLNWQLTLEGDGQGCVARGSVCRFSDKARAQAVGDVWVRTGVAPADQPAIGAA